MSPNAYNGLGVGTTQLYNTPVVYNHKRHGEFELNGRPYDFRRRASFPKSVSEEFLLVDLLHNLNRLAEDQDAVRARAGARQTDGSQAPDQGGLRLRLGQGSRAPGSCSQRRRSEARSMTFLDEQPDFGDLLAVVGDTRKIDPGLVEKDYWLMHTL